MRRLIPLTLLILAACGNPAAPATPGLHPLSTQTALPAVMPCLVVNLPTTPAPALSAQFGDRGHVLGQADAPVTIVEFGDYQCAQCASLDDLLMQIRSAHPADVRLIYLHAPQAGNDKAGLAIQAAEAAGLQGKFWEMHTLLYEKQAQWTGLIPAQFTAWAGQQASSLGLDTDRFRSDFQGKAVAQRVEQAFAASAGVQQAPPILFINSNLPYTGRWDPAGLDQVVSLMALARKQFSACPPMIIDPAKQYTASLETSQGAIAVQLYADKAPLAVNDFVFLAKAHWYDGNIFLRVLPGVLAETGDPSGTGLGNPGYYFNTEIASGLHFDRPGMLAMSNTGPGTNASSFFITAAAAPDMDGRYTIFGEVISGLNVLAGLSPRDPNPGQLLPPGDRLIQVTITEH